MTMTELMAITAALLCALAVLPGTLGILMYTYKFASSDSGARFIYGKSFRVLLASVLLMLIAGYQALLADSVSLVFIAALVIYAGVCIFGFFMHTKLMFKPVRNPIFISLDEAIEKFGPDEEVVGVIDNKGKPFAFIARLARRPHIVYQPEGDDPFIMTHCILAHSSMSYAMEDKFRQPDIDITAALANNLVFYEKTNQCSVIQIQNQSRNGTLPLRTLPTVAVSLSTWQTLYPESKVWLRPIEWRDIFYLKILARADVIDPNSPVIVYPLQHPNDERLPMKSMVNGVTIDGMTRTYPVSLLEKQPVINDELGGSSIVVVSAFNNNYNQVFDRQLNGEVLTFKISDTENRFVDNETGSVWSATGECISGSRQGDKLRPIPHYNKMFWYVWSDFNPGTEIYEVKKTEQKAA